MPFLFRSSKEKVKLGIKVFMNVIGFEKMVLVHGPTFLKRWCSLTFLFFPLKTKTQFGSSPDHTLLHHLDKLGGIAGESIIGEDEQGEDGTGGDCPTVDRCVEGRIFEVQEHAKGALFSLALDDESNRGKSVAGEEKLREESCRRGEENRRRKRSFLEKLLRRKEKAE
ncbi:hypothetical protein NE237_027998 [Protea cynaroides]|uniref:Uncharacterized protein n=1 Tax=Protea cynaroides TaxID=273540 RepID=A0A9Q0JTI3_9MAGN|nr:hypothetical protein NE237_027998 [Protea cynaroides]